MNKIILLLNTLRYLKFRQVFYRVFYRLVRYPKSYSKIKVWVPENCGDLKLTVWIEKPVSFQTNNFSFLNLTKYFPGLIDWNCKEYGMLWNYNLNYMDYLLQSDMSSEKGTRLIEEFIIQMENNTAGMDPYPISLRGINWVKFLTANSVTAKNIDKFLFIQYKVLSKNIEYHLLGNHLLENGFSLLFGAFYFKNHNFFRKASNIIVAELTEQILPDGGHFELSPMYHRIILDRLLDSINLLQNNNRFESQENLLTQMRQKAVAMIKWMNTVSFNSGSLPLLNDSANGVAPISDELNRYAIRLGIKAEGKAELKESGYRIFENDKYKVIADVGHIGPDYQPGHAHADTFNFELYLENKPLIVETGVSTYDNNSRRLQERSTTAHNTVHLESKNSSQVWGGFRVGKRAKIVSFEENVYSVKAKHNGFSDLDVFHERELCSEPHSFIIKDQLSGDLKSFGIAKFHFHPEINFYLEENQINFNGGSICFENADSVSSEEYFYAPEFNTLIPGRAVKVIFQEKLKTTIIF